MEDSPTLKLIKKRRSIRRFKKKSIPWWLIEKILEAGRWAPSGLNNQPWRFKVLEGEEKDKLSEFTHYSFIVRNADKLILVFLDKTASYDYKKDLLAVGACIENMLLCGESYKIGSCWLGEILKREKQIKSFLGVSKNLELCAVIALGYPQRIPQGSQRKPLKKLII